ncbi:MAG: HAD superfamily phosphoserine phosphatase-like hydrolase [Arenicella sp.]
MALALFDLDNTLLNGDSDHAWGLFLAKVGAVDVQKQQQQQNYFYQQYQDGSLDILKFLEYQLAPLAHFSLTHLEAWRSEFIDTVIKPMIDSGKPELIEKHRLQNDELVIITATNDFITRPIANELGVATLIATQAEMLNGKYTGKCKGTPCFQAGKVERLEQWLSSIRMGTTQGGSMKADPEQSKYKERYFYSDSINDLALLELVDHPIAVTPDDKLRAHAKELHWQIID